jgi:acyl carrier protein
MSVKLDDVKRIISLQLGNRAVGDEDHFVRDLGAESMDVMNIVIAIEDKFGVEIKESEIPGILNSATLYEFVKSRI